MALKCPEGMVLIKSGDPFCINKTEISQSVASAFQKEGQQQPKGPLAGPNKPAVYYSKDRAQTVCQTIYQDGDLPSIKQWKAACGDKRFCTASGDLNHKEVVYNSSAPADVGSKTPNSNGVYDMAGSVWEWLRDVGPNGCIYHIGGSWYSHIQELLTAGFLRCGSLESMSWSSPIIGFRCVAPAVEEGEL